MRKTIYIPDDGTWEAVEAECKKRDLSVSELLLSSFKKDSQLDRIEALLVGMKDVLSPVESLLAELKQGWSPAVMAGQKPQSDHPLGRPVLKPKVSDLPPLSSDDEPYVPDDKAKKIEAIKSMGLTPASEVRSFSKDYQLGKKK